MEVIGNSDSVSEDGSKDAGDETQDAMDLVAAKDGTITEIITRNGVPLVKAGDSVKKGQILVSGQFRFTMIRKKLSPTKPVRLTRIFWQKLRWIMLIVFHLLISGRAMKKECASGVLSSDKRDENPERED